MVNTNKGEYDRAIEDYSKALALEPRDVDIYNSRALAYIKLGREEEARRDFEMYNELMQE